MKKHDDECAGRSNVLARFDGDHDSEPLKTLVESLLDQQKASWRDFAAHSEKLKNVRTRRFEYDRFSLALQFNYGRLKSTAAPVDPEVINSRRCFLCQENLPIEQKGILYRRSYMVLCNPYPIFPGHLTIAHLQHRPQAIETEFTALLKLAEDFGPDYLVFYNGPQCGASAPDHMHFQGAPKGLMPIEQDLLRTRGPLDRKRISGVDITRFLGFGREIVMLEGRELAELAAVMNRFCDVMKQMLHLTAEPMINLYSSYSGCSWQVVLFLRSKHRPDVYFSESDGRIMVSPGLVDMGGLLITPREKDFDNLDARSAGKILQEVSLESRTVEDVMARL
jgi:hypothetical protein